MSVLRKATEALSGFSTPNLDQEKSLQGVTREKNLTFPKSVQDLNRRP